MTSKYKFKIYTHVHILIHPHHNHIHTHMHTQTSELCNLKSRKIGTPKMSKRLFSNFNKIITTFVVIKLYISLNSIFTIYYAYRASHERTKQINISFPNTTQIYNRTLTRLLSFRNLAHSSFSYLLVSVPFLPAYI